MEQHLELGLALELELGLELELVLVLDQLGLELELGLELLVVELLELVVVEQQPLVALVVLEVLEVVVLGGRVVQRLGQLLLLLANSRWHFGRHIQLCLQQGVGRVGAHWQGRILELATYGRLPSGYRRHQPGRSSAWHSFLFRILMRFLLSIWRRVLLWLFLRCLCRLSLL